MVQCPKDEDLWYTIDLKSARTGTKLGQTYRNQAKQIIKRKKGKKSEIRSHAKQFDTDCRLAQLCQLSLISSTVHCTLYTCLF